jgi:hypothetical protein
MEIIKEYVPKQFQTQPLKYFNWPLPFIWPWPSPSFNFDHQHSFDPDHPHNVWTDQHLILTITIYSWPFAEDEGDEEECFKTVSDITVAAVHTFGYIPCWPISVWGGGWCPASSSAFPHCLRDFHSLNLNNHLDFCTEPRNPNNWEPGLPSILKWSVMLIWKREEKKEGKWWHFHPFFCKFDWSIPKLRLRCCTYLRY